MMVAIFPIYFTGICEASGQSGDFWWSVGTAIATTISAIVAPLLGAVADYRGMKKKLFASFLGLGLVFCLFCLFTDHWQGLLLGYVFSHIGFCGSCMFYDSFLTDVTTTDRMDRVSSWGFSMGYIGGSTIPFLLAIALVTFGENFGIDSIMAVKYSIVITVVWWAIFSIPMLKNCHQQYGEEMPKNDLVKKTLHSLWQSLKMLAKNRALFLFVMAYFFYIDGVNTVISMSTAFGATLGLDTVGMILALLVTQLVAFPCTILFGKLSGKHGAIRMIAGAIGIYFVICCFGFVMGFGIEEAFLTTSQATAIFWVLAVLVGTVQGGIQALSRSYFGKLIPKEKASEYFGVFDIFGKFAAILGPTLYAVIKGFTGRSSFAMLAIIIIFFLGGFFLLLSAKESQKEGQAPLSL